MFSKRWMLLAGVLLMVPGIALAQPGGSATSVPHTSWGDPDLQGVWDFRSLTPMERPSELSGQEVFTAEEAAEFSADTIRRRSRDSETSDRAARAAQGDIVPYNDFWFDEGTTVTTDRTSLIVDPPGQNPALDPGGRAGAGGTTRGSPWGWPGRTAARRMGRGSGGWGSLHTGIQRGAAHAAERL